VQDVETTLTPFSQRASASSGVKQGSLKEKGIVVRFLICSTYTAQQEAAAQAAAMRSTQALQQRGALAHLREAFLGPTPVEVWHYQQIKLSGDEARRWAKGRLGEEIFFHRLGHVLHDRYLLLLDYPSPQKYGDIDGVLIGPHGVTIYEVKAWTGTYRASDTEWLYWSEREGQWVPARGSNPIQQARRHAESLRLLLRQANLSSVPVYPAVAFASKQMNLEATSSVPIFFLTEQNLTLQELLGRQGQVGDLTPEIQKRVETTIMAPIQAAPLLPPPLLYKTPDQLVEEGQTFYQAGQFEVALARYQQALSMDPSLAVAHNNISAALISLQHHPEALQAAERAIHLNPRLAAAYSNKALALVKLRRTQEALAVCDSAIRLNPALKSAYNVKGLALLELGYTQAALAEFDYTLTLDAFMAVAHQNRGVALERLGRRTEAQQAYQRARQLGYVAASPKTRQQQK